LEIEMTPVRTVTVELPETLYRQAEETAAATSLSLEEVLAQSIALSLPPLEDDIPTELRAELSAMMLLSDDELWQIARDELDDAKQERLRLLTEARKGRDLTSDEASELATLLDEGDLIMLKKAESYRLLTRRGHIIPWLNP
jgi:hypothetical protein